MGYHYEFDSTLTGDFRLSRMRYQVVQEGLRLLCDELKAWNQRATEHGATYPPYEHEVADLTQLLEFGEQQLGEANAQEIVVRGISVGNLRYVKAALMFVTQRRQQECAKKAQDGWPEGAVSSLADGVEKVKNLAGAVDCEPSDILWEALPKEPVIPRGQGTPYAEWEVFVSHASEDKEAFVRPLAKGLQECGLRVWFDEATLRVGDSLRQSIDRGLARSKFGVVVISPSVLQKNWPQKELDGLVAREVGGAKVLLPVWHEIGPNEIRAYSPTLADRVAVSSARGLEYVIAELVRAIAPEESTELVELPNTEAPKVPATADVIDRLQKYLVDDIHRIELHKLVIGETETVHTKLTDARFPVLGVPFRVPEIAGRLKEYESLTGRLRAIVLTGCRWGAPKHAAYWAGCLRRIANPPVTHFGDGEWFNFRWYPALLVLYAGGVAAVAAPGYEALAALLSPQIKVRSVAGELPLIRLVNTGMILDERLAVNLPGVKGVLHSKPTPFSQHIHAALCESFQDLLPEDAQYDACFHRFECFLTLVHRDVAPDWPITLPGRFAWQAKETWVEIVREAAEAKEEWPALRAGLFGGSIRRFSQAEAFCRERLWGV